MFTTVWGWEWDGVRAIKMGTDVARTGWGWGQVLREWGAVPVQLPTTTSSVT